MAEISFNSCIMSCFFDTLELFERVVFEGSFNVIVFALSRVNVIFCLPLGGYISEFDSGST